MSTRERRSRGGGEGSLNPTMIQLLDVGRLRKELELRGLDTKGNKQVLADRLQEAVLGGGIGYDAVPARGTKRKAPEPEATTSSEPTPKSPKKKSPVKKGGRKSKVESADESMEISTADNSESVELSEVKEPDASAEAVKEVKKSGKKKPATLKAKSKIPENQEQSTSVDKKSDKDNDEGNEKKNLETEKITSKQTPNRQEKSPTKKKDKKSKTKDADESLEVSSEVGASETSKSLIEENVDESVKLDVPSEKTSETTKKVKKSEEKKATSEMKQGTVEKRRLSLQKPLSSKVTEPAKSPTLGKKSTSVTPKQSVTFVDDTISDDQAAGRIKRKGSESEGTTSSEHTPTEKTPILSEGKQVDTERRLSSSQKSSGLTPRVIVPVKSSSSSKKPAPVSQRQSTTSLDLLDTILDDQSVMLTQKYKTEDERSEERQKIEFEKRMKSQGSYILPPVEKRNALSSRRDSVSGPLKVSTPDSPHVGPRSDPIKQQSSKSLLSSSSSLPHDSSRGVSIEERLHQIFNDVSPISPAPEYLSPQSQSAASSAKPVPPPPPGPRPPTARPLRPGPPPPPPGPRPPTARPLAVPPPPPGPRPLTARPLRPQPPPRPPPPTARRTEPSQVSSSVSVPPPPHVSMVEVSTSQMAPQVSPAARSEAPIPPEPIQKPRTKFDQPPPELPVSIQLPPPGLRQLPKTRFDQPPPGVSIPLSVPSPKIVPLPITESSSFSEPKRPEPKPADAPIQTLPPPQLLTELPKRVPPPPPIVMPSPLMPYQYNIPVFDPNVPPPVITMIPPAHIPPPPVSMPFQKEEEATETSEITPVDQSKPYETDSKEEESAIPMDISVEGDEDDEAEIQNSYLMPRESPVEEGGYDPLQASMIVRTRETLLEDEQKKTTADNEGSESSSSEDEADEDSDSSSTTSSDDSNVVNGKVEQTSTVKPVTTNESTSKPVAEVNFDALKMNPTLLLQKASDVLKTLEGSKPQILQEELVGEYEVIEEEKPPPDFHGEPVPEDEDDDDALFEMAAGMPRKKKEPKPIVEEPLPDERFIELDYYNSDFNMKANAENKWLIEPDNGDGFALMWGGVRSNYGIVVPEGEFPRIAFQVSIAEFLSTKHVPFEELDPHDIRIGWSASTSSNTLGESPKSYGFCSTERKCAEGVFSTFGESFHLEDVITSVLDLSAQEIIYYKNGESLGTAFSGGLFNPGEVVYPHVATKNCKIFVNFGVECPDKEHEEKWRLPDVEKEKKTIFVGQLDMSTQLKPSKRPPAEKSDCTLILMVGLPGVGKTTWVNKYLREHPDEEWIHFNTEKILDMMKVNGVPRKRIQTGRLDMILGLTAKALTRSLQMACRRRHNYIVDQTHCNREARKKRLALFEGFTRRCVVILPNETEAEDRRAKRARTDPSGELPVEALLEFKATISLPTMEEEPLEDVAFVEPTLDRISEAIEQVQRYNEEGQPWIRKNSKKFKPQPMISDHRNQNTNSGWVDNRKQNWQGNVTKAPEKSNAENYLQVSLGPILQTANPSQVTPPANVRANEGYAGFGMSVPPPVSIPVTSSVPEFNPSVPPPPILPMAGQMPSQISPLVGQRPSINISSNSSMWPSTAGASITPRENK